MTTSGTGLRGFIGGDDADRTRIEYVMHRIGS